MTTRRYHRIKKVDASKRRSAAVFSDAFPRRSKRGI
jgi:hypothetical protein